MRIGVKLAATSAEVRGCRRSRLADRDHRTRPARDLCRRRVTTRAADVGVVTRREAQRYARAVGDLDPIYFDEEAARDAGYDGLVAPPTFVGHAVVEGGDARRPPRGRPLDRPRPQASASRVSRTMFGGEEWEFHRPGPRRRHDHRAAPPRRRRGEGRPIGTVRAAALRDDVHQPARRGRRRLAARRDRPMSEQRLDRRRHVGDELEPVDPQRVAGPAVPLQRGDPQPAPDPLRPRVRRRRGPPGHHRPRTAAGRLAEPVRHRLGRAARPDADADVAEPPLGGARARLQFRGTVAAVDGDVVHLDVRAEDGDGTVLMPGTATVRLPTT